MRYVCRPLFFANEERIVSLTNNHTHGCFHVTGQLTLPHLNGGQKSLYKQESTTSEAQRAMTRILF